MTVVTLRNVPSVSTPVYE